MLVKKCFLSSSVQRFCLECSLSNITIAGDDYSYRSSKTCLKCYRYLLKREGEGLGNSLLKCFPCGIRRTQLRKVEKKTRGTHADTISSSSHP